VVSAAHHSRNFGKARKGVRTPGDRCAEPGELQLAGESIFAGNSLERMAAEWSRRVGKTVEDGPALLGESYTEVRYEDLLERPEEEVRRLLEFLGAGSNEEIVRRCVNAASFERLSGGRERGKEDSSSFFRKGVAGDWRRFFTREDRRIFKQEAGELLIEIGYETDNNW
jgi:hypothetical protein